MKNLKNFFSRDEIISYICKIRCKVAKSRNNKHLIHLLTKEKKFNYHQNEMIRFNEAKELNCSEFLKYECDLLSLLNSMLPPRKKWVKVGEKFRKNKVNNQLISSVDKNYYSLKKTIKLYSSKSNKDPWLLELEKFIECIQNSIFSGAYKISPPLIFPKLKNEKNRNGPNECRPLSMYSLADRIVLSFANKYLTKMFDINFKDCSFAFRHKKNKENTKIVNHHDCIKELLDYRKINSDIPLWVVECDIEKFFDSLNHSIVKNCFFDLCKLSENRGTQEDIDIVSGIFMQYLDSYCFNKNVLCLNGMLDYWKGYDISKGNFSWLDKQFNELGYYSNLEEERIGVPQGGALSGLIANMVLHTADCEVVNTGAFYIRFCDDMIIMHPDREICSLAKSEYVNAIIKLKLVPHDFSDIYREKRKIKKINLPDESFAPFWKSKSKGPYKWSSIDSGGNPWISFVGYEINYEGFIRVRKRSFHKEIKKQGKVIQHIKRAVKKGMRKNIGSVTESAISRLVGMSVGRVTLRNYETLSNNYCWKNGFKELTPNKYSISQIKQLDRNRSKLYYRFRQQISDREDLEKLKSKKRQIIHFNKPFSYYYQVLERNKGL